jgi:hypothetical protein
LEVDVIYTWKQLKDVIARLDIPDDVYIEEVTIVEPSEENKVVVMISEDGKRCVIEN